MKIVCYGDSNTYGWDPRSFSGNRYAHPWPELMAEMTGHDVTNCGEPGRTVPCREEHLKWFARDVKAAAPDLLIIMLGTNDLFYTLAPTADRVADRMRNMVRYAIRNELAERILLLSCACIAIPEEGYGDMLEEMSERYREIAEEEGIRFADPFRWEIPLAYDGVHFTEEGHRIFAERISKSVKTVLF